MMDEGVIKFRCDWQPGPPIDAAVFDQINPSRQQLCRHGLIGEDDHGIGFGNLSARATQGDAYGDTVFVITGTGTGGTPTLTPDHYTRVTGYDLDTNRLSCRGPIRASSESLTHAALYEADPQIQAVAHVHHLGLWQRLLYRVPTTPRQIPYGTPAMAHAVIALYRTTDLPTTRVLAMAGHRAGLVAFGSTPDDATDPLIRSLEAQPNQHHEP